MCITNIMCLRVFNLTYAIIFTFQRQANLRGYVISRTHNIIVKYAVLKLIYTGSNNVPNPQWKFQIKQLLLQVSAYHMIIIIIIITGETKESIFTFPTKI